MFILNKDEKEMITTRHINKKKSDIRIFKISQAVRLIKSTWEKS